MSEKINKTILIAIIFILLIGITLLTQYYGSTDLADYSDTAKFFAGSYSAKIRNSHSYFYGFMLSPLVKLTSSFIGFKITSLIFLMLLIYSIYHITKSKKAFWLALLSPVVWYMAPWISPIQLASLLFLWGYYFITKYEEKGKLKFLFYSGLLVGLSWVVWDTILFFGFFLGIVFLWSKKLSHSIFFLIALLIGLSPRLILDFYLFNFPFFTMMKSTFGTFANVSGGIYGYGALERATAYSSGLIMFLPVFLSIPIYYWKLYRPKFFKQNKKSMIFLTISLLLIFINPQIRYTLLLVPIILVILSKNLTQQQFEKQIAFSLVVIILFIFPTIIQIGYPINNHNYRDFTYVLENSFQVTLDKISDEQLMQQDLKQIIEDYPHEVFVVGNLPDSYQFLAHDYWGDEVKELVSIQDYELFLNNSTILYEKTFRPPPNIQDRRQIWISGGMSKNLNDKTDYDSISLAISIREPIDLKNAVLIKKYNLLYLSKINSDV